MAEIKFPIDFNNIRVTFAREIKKVTGLTAIYAEPEVQHEPRPKKPYFTFKLTVPAAKSGDDSKDVVYSGSTPTTVVNSGGVRKMTVVFDCYGKSHEEAYNYMGLWQTSLDLENIQEDFRAQGIAVWVIGDVADLSQLLNTGYEGRSHMECTFGIAMNLTSDLGEMDSGLVVGEIDTNQDIIDVDVTY